MEKANIILVAEAGHNIIPSDCFNPATSYSDIMSKCWDTGLIVHVRKAQLHSAGADATTLFKLMSLFFSK
jgi:hypothetical protein